MEKEKKGWSEKVKLITMAGLAVAILSGAFVLFWQIQKQNSPAKNPYADAQELQSEVNNLNKKIDDLNKALEDAKKGVVETSVTTNTTVRSTGGKVAGAETEKQTGLVNINTASASQLETLPGIGPTYAKRIIDYRQSNGGFKSIEEIQNVKGIGPKTFEKLKDLITV
jgi:competence protein ComEA